MSAAVQLDQAQAEHAQEATPTLHARTAEQILEVLTPQNPHEAIPEFTLTTEERKVLQDKIRQDYARKLDYKYKNREKAIMSVALKDYRDNARSGFYFTAGGLVATSGFLTSIGFLTTHSRWYLRFHRLPVLAVVSGLLFWSWTGATHRDFEDQSRGVNQKISLEINKMMDLD